MDIDSDSDYDYDYDYDSDYEYSMLGVNSSQALGTSAQVYAKDVRKCLKKELVDKLIHDDSSVFSHLRIDDVDQHLVQLCQRALIADESFLSSREHYEKLRGKAEKNYTPGGVPSMKDEREMMGPLKTVIGLINELFNKQQPQKYDRKWISTGAKKFVGEAHTFFFPKLCPDFSMCDMIQYNEHAKHSKAKNNDEEIWRHRLSFLELKATKHQGVKGAKDETVTDTTTQAADYARLHISGKPFQLFSIGLIIFGSKFCVGIFDRDGVRFSPIHDLWDNLDIFIRVIRRLTADMSPVELGQEPNVDILPLQHKISMACREYALSLTSDSPNTLLTYPTHAIRYKNTAYYTIGFPVWSAVSLLGRGTTIWRVSSSSKPTQGSILIMKTMWRRSGRLGESEIYKQIRGKHDGLLQFADGMDVVFPQSFVHRKITTTNLRYPDVNDEVGTTVLHRLFLKTDGRPLWEFDSFLDFFLGIKAALQAHEFLVAQGILHRDISAGNILLSSNPDAPDSQKGFLADLEFAALIVIAKEEKTPVPSVKGGKAPDGAERTHLRFEPPPHGAVLTGTVQFMAYELLINIERGLTIEHQVNHDIESFIWTMYYGILRRIVFNKRPIREMKVSDMMSEVTKGAFNTLFGHVGIDKIRGSRYITPPWHDLVPEPLPTFLDVFLRRLHDYVANTLRRISVVSGGSANRSQASHADLIRFLDTAIMTIRQQPHA